MIRQEVRYRPDSDEHAFATVCSKGRSYLRAASKSKEFTYRQASFAWIDPDFIIDVYHKEHGYTD